MCTIYKPLQKSLETNAESCLSVYELIENCMALSWLYLLLSQDEALKLELYFSFSRHWIVLPCSLLPLSTSGKLVLWQECCLSLPLPMEMESFIVWMGEEAVHFWMTSLEAMEEQNFSICGKSHTAAHLLLQQTGSAGFWHLKSPRSCVSWMLKFGWPHFYSWPGQWLWAVAFVPDEVFPSWCLSVASASHTCLVCKLLLQRQSGVGCKGPLATFFFFLFDNLTSFGGIFKHWFVVLATQGVSTWALEWRKSGFL